MSNKETGFDVSLGKATSAFSKLLCELGTNGKRVIENLDRDPVYARRIARFMQNNGHSLYVSQMRAREIMGNNFLAIEDVIKHFGVSFTDDEMAALRDIPFSEAELLECKDTHVLFPGYPISQQEIYNRVPNLFFKKYWYNCRNLDSKKKVELRWYLIRKDIVECSKNRTYQEQTEERLTVNEEVPRECELIYMIILYFMVYQVRLFENVFARCADSSYSGVRAIVGYFGSEGLHIPGCADDRSEEHVGLAASWKF